jgi:3-methyladenine DNA glycosylase AlkD
VSLVHDLRAALEQHADPAKAPAMQAYMKSAMPYRGVASPGQKAIFREVLGARPLESRASWESAVLELWDDAQFREERYAAIALLAYRRYAGWRDPQTLPLIDHLVVTGAWWDYVDALATRTLGPLARAYPAELVPLIRTWAADDDLWRRRAAIIHQVGAGDAADRDLLAACVAPSLEPNPMSREFFLRKAIGWALRDLARRDPSWVRAYTAEHAAELSGLSRREALTHLVTGE